MDLNKHKNKGTIAFSAPEMFVGGEYTFPIFISFLNNFETVKLSTFGVQVWFFTRCYVGLSLFELNSKISIKILFLFYFYSVHELIEKITNQKVDFSNKAWNDISQDAKDLISQLLIKNPDDRITVEEALGSDWMVKLK